MSNNKSTPHTFTSGYPITDLKSGDYLYMLPQGRKGLWWDPEIKEVLSSYGKLNIDLSNEDVQDKITAEIGGAIRALPLNPIVVDNPPIMRLDDTGNEYIIFPDGSSLEDAN